MRHALLVALVVVVPFSACGGSPPTPHEVTVLPSASASASAGPAVDLSPVAMPDSVIVLVHASHVGATGDMVSEWAGQPLDVEQPLGELVGERIGKLVDLDASADMTVMAKDRGGKQEPEMRVAVALSVKNFDAAKGLLQGEYGLLPIANGAFEITRSGSHRHDGDSEFRACALAPSDAGGRIVCSNDAASRDSVLPYLTRGVGALKTLKSDVHVEARPGPFREMVKRERASITQSASRFMGGGRELKGVWESALADMCDGFLDAERATLDGNIDAKLGMVDLKVTAKGSRGLVTRILTGHPDRAEPVPASFLRLPAESDVAFFGHGLDADQIASPKNELLTAINAALVSDDKMKDDRKLTSEALSHGIDLATLPIVYARGVDIAKALPAVAGLTESSDAAKIRAGLEQAGGWDIIGVEVSSDKIVAIVKEWSALLARPAIVAQMKGDIVPTWKVLGPARNAPPGTIHVTLAASHEDNEWANGKQKKRPPIVLTLHTLIVPDQTRTWIVSSLDEATALAKARTLMANAATGTLATREGLDALRSGRLNAGGFATPRSVGMGVPLSWLFASNLRYKVSTDPLMGISAQSQYTTPVVYTFAESASAGESAFTLGLRVPRAVLADVMQVGPRLFH